MIVTDLARSTRVTRAAYSVIGAPQMESRWSRTAVPFEVELTWQDGVMSLDVVVHSWLLRDDGSVRKVVTRTMDLAAEAPPWLFSQFRQTPEPGVAPALPPALPPAEAPAVVVDAEDGGS